MKAVLIIQKAEDSQKYTDLSADFDRSGLVYYGDGKLLTYIGIIKNETICQEVVQDLLETLISYEQNMIQQIMLFIPSQYTESLPIPYIDEVNGYKSAFIKVKDDKFSFMGPK